MSRIRRPNLPKKPTGPMKPQPKPKQRVGGRPMSAIDSSKRGIKGKTKGYSMGGKIDGNKSARREYKHGGEVMPKAKPC
jgi:hypothetical protein